MNDIKFTIKRMKLEFISNVTPRERSARQARQAAYGSPTARTPASYTLLEAIEACAKERIEHGGKKGAKAKVSE